MKGDSKVEKFNDKKQFESIEIEIDQDIANEIANANITPSLNKDNNVSANSNKETKPEQVQKLINPTKLLDLGATIGLQPKKWNPKMAEYIFTKKPSPKTDDNNSERRPSNYSKPSNHIIDLPKIASSLNEAYNFLIKTTQKGGKVLIVGTKGNKINDLIKDEATRSHSYYVNQRWLGGTLTNFKTIKNSINKMNDNLQTIQDNSIDNYTKNEQIKIHKDTDKLLKFYGGIRTMRRLPSVLLILDPVHDLNAVLEARKLNIPIIAFANTNADPDLIDYIVPLNNNSIRSIAFVLGVLNDAICSVLGEPLNFVGKKDSEIILPPPAVKKTWKNNNNNWKNNNNNYNKNREYKPTEKK